MDGLVDRLLALAGGQSRAFVAIVGAPGAGKSTLTDALLAAVEAVSPGAAAILPMDGFHYDDALLDGRGWLKRKGAPHTFDSDGLAATLDSLAPADRPVAVPVFDRSLEISRAAARIIEPSARVILVEGNYLLLDDPAWTPLRARFDLSVVLDVPLETLRARLESRWAHLPAAVARAKVEENDLPNARLVIEESGPADLTLDTLSPKTTGNLT